MANLIDRAMARRTDPDFERSFAIKLVIWDLDDTLWQGTLADGDDPVLDERRAGYVRAFNRHGIVSAICSKNDHATAQTRLERFALWDAFVFPRIAFVPKGPAIARLIADMQLLPANVLFIDDNRRNLEEVAMAAPGIRVVDATSPECDLLLERILDDHRHIDRNRIADYRILETRVAERRQSSLTDDAFLRQSGIEATYAHRMDNLDFAERIEELINRSNQLNYTGSRVADGSVKAQIMNVSDYDVYCAFVWDRYGYYGLVGVAIYDCVAHELLHFAFSCRVMHMGVEDFLLRALAERYGEIGLGRLCKPLPARPSGAIRAVPFEDPAVRERVLAQEAPRDWSQIRLRLMCDCQSGAFHHYSRFRDEIDFDNIPRIFTLPMMLTGQYRDQHFPQYLVYTPATDYMDWRWTELMPAIERAAYVEAAERFRDMILCDDRKLLLVLPPEDAPEASYDVIPTVSAAAMKERNRDLNRLWRTMAARHPGHMHVIDMSDFAGEPGRMEAYHYVPSVLKQVAEQIDAWYEPLRA